MSSKKGAGRKFGDYRIVPNVEDSKRPKNAASRKSQQRDANLLKDAYAANARNKKYDVVEDENGVAVVVREKSSGRVITKFDAGSAGKKFSLRKPSLRPRPGTIAIKKILDAI